MKELAKLQLSELSGEIVDIDVTPGGSFVGVVAGVEHRVERTTVRGQEFTMPFVDLIEPRLIFGSSHSVAILPDTCRFPIVRAMDEETAVVGAVVVSGRGTPGHSVNAWIFERGGRELCGFAVGDAVQDVVFIDDRISITYFDEGIFSNSSPPAEGVASFDRRGAFQWGYHSEFGYDTASISDCDAACADEQSLS